MEQLTLKAIRINLGLTADEMASKVGLKNGDQWYRRENYQTPIEGWVTANLMSLVNLDIKQIKLK